MSDKSQDPQFLARCSFCEFEWDALTEDEECPVAHERTGATVSFRRISRTAQTQEEQIACEWCGPVCSRGAAHNSRKEDGVRYGTLPGELPAAAPQPQEASAQAAVSEPAKAYDNGGKEQTASDKASAPGELEEAKKRVLSKYPGYDAMRFNSEVWFIGKPWDRIETVIGRGPTEDAAWLDAASKLPSTPEGATGKGEDKQIRCEVCGRAAMDFWGVANSLVCIDCPEPEGEGGSGEFEREYKVTVATNHEEYCNQFENDLQHLAHQWLTIRSERAAQPPAPLESAEAMDAADVMAGAIVRTAYLYGLADKSRSYQRHEVVELAHQLHLLMQAVIDKLEPERLAKVKDDIQKWQARSLYRTSGEQALPNAITRADTEKERN